jgi:hypothetical protein
MTAQAFAVAMAAIGVNGPAARVKIVRRVVQGFIELSDPVSGPGGMAAIHRSAKAFIRGTCRRVKKLELPPVPSDAFADSTVAGRVELERVAPPAASVCGLVAAVPAG